MQIIEQLGCVSDAGTDPARRRRIKCCAAALGVVVLVAAVSIGYVLKPGDASRHDVANAEAAVHE